MSSDSPLRQIQEMVWDLIAAPEGVEKGAADMKKSGILETTDLSFLVRGDDRLSPAQRLDIYASMYFYRLRDGLAGDFSKVAEVMERRVSTVPLYASTSELPDIFERGEVALVVDDDQRVKGLITKLDLIEYLTKSPQV